MSDLVLDVLDDGEPIDGYWLRLTCPRCGAPARHRADGRPSPGGGHVGAVAECTGCQAQLLVHVSVSCSHGRPVPGTRPPNGAPR